MVELIVVVLLAFGVSVSLVPACRFIARRYGFTAKPREDRWHSKPTALLGGIAIAVTVLTVHSLVAGPKTLPVLIAGVTLMFVVGLIDDVVTLKPYTKLVA